MKKSIAIWGAAIVLFALAWFVVRDRGNGNIAAGNTSPGAQVSWPTASAGTEPGQKPANFTLSDLAGNQVSLDDFKGKYVYLNFWATWCPPCRGELPGIEKVYQQYKDKDLVVLAVDLGEEKQTVQSFMRQNGYDFRVLLDTDQSVGTQYNINAIPVSYFIDKDGNTVSQRVGALTEEELQADIAELVSK